MSWADAHLARLRAGETVQLRPHGGSMRVRIESGQLVTIAPTTPDPDIGDAALYRVRGRILGVVMAVEPSPVRGCNTRVSGRRRFDAGGQ